MMAIAKTASPYTVVDDKTGEKGTYCNILGHAQERAKANGFSDKVINQAQYDRLFGK